MRKLFYILAVAFVCISSIAADDDSSSGRINNGMIAGDRQFPYAVSIQRIVGSVNVPTRGHRCGGVMFTLQHLLTAGRCTFNTEVITGQPSITHIVTSEYRVFAGTILTADISPNVTRTIANFTLHPGYSGGPAFINDIAIMTLITPFPASAVTPIPLPSSNFRPADHTRCVVAGWGATEIGSIMPTTEMWFANKYIYNQDHCTSIFNVQAGVLNILPTMVCAASENFITTGCWGDEGNALVCGGTLTGISFLTNACYGSSFPELYTRVSNYTTWIRQETGSASNFKPTAITLLLFTIVHAAFQKILVE